MTDALTILQEYWGYTSFRPPQEEVIRTVLENRDALALMPTGGGKSLCFQVPTLMRPGLCVVVTPLIALMKDQVQQLKALNIKAEAIHTGMSPREIDIKLDNCIYGDIKFLYLSPERLQSELFKARLAKMNVNLLVVDEAHCISEWGYDFRPSYLAIAQIRILLPGVPILALTATATPEVKLDIVKQLAFENGAEFQVSFARPNLCYAVENTEDKMGTLIRLLKRYEGSTLVYVNTRRKTRSIAQDLQREGFKSSYYHGGLTGQERSAIQDRWLNDQTRIIVATNAFGMGINKASVRLVVHYDMPDNLEGYYQEAGRAGRDGVSSAAILLYQEGDMEATRERKENEYPPISFLRDTYQHLANYYQLAEGSYPGTSLDFDLDFFSNKFQQKPLAVFHALRKLELFGYLELTEQFFEPSRFRFTVDHQLLYEFQIANAPFDAIIKVLLRLHGGEIFTHAMKINENKMAKLLNQPLEYVQRQLLSLQDREISIYQPRKDQPQLSFTTPRQDPSHMIFDQKTYQIRRKLEMDKLSSVRAYVGNSIRCRSQQLLEYFGEVTDSRCGTCDVCLGSPEEPFNQFETQYRLICQQLTRSPLTLNGLVSNLPALDQRSVASTVQQMLDNGDLIYDPLGRLMLAVGMA